MDTSARPLIILGAGASHDFAHSDLRRFRVLPVTDQLVQREYLDYNIAEKYEEVKTLFSRIGPVVLKKGANKSLEEALGDITNHQQLTALRFYLADYFQMLSNGDLSKEYINNYRALIDHILEGQAKGADIITFNYDTLLEQQFGKSRSFKNMGDYVRPDQPISLTKVHGSSNWSYIIRKDIYDQYSDISNGFEWLKNNTNFSGGHYYTNEHIDALGAEQNDFYRIPALAIPINKDKKFICPQDHIDHLTRILSNTSRILIIGWKAGDPHLLGLMQNLYKYKIPVFLVTGPGGAQDVKNNLSKVTSLEIAGEMEGFGNFIGSTMAKTFFW